MNKFKMTIIGGGTAGWCAAAWFSKFFKEIDITLIESPNVPKIGVGESVTPHVAKFLKDMGVDPVHCMKHTGSIHKYANKFVGWRNGGDEKEYFSFNYTTNTEMLFNEVAFSRSFEDLKFNYDKPRTTDALMQLLEKNTFNKFDKYFNSQFHYMENNVAPYNEQGEYLLNPLYSWSQHINADLMAEYLRDFIALPNGVKHVQSLVDSVRVNEGNIDSITLEDGQTISSNIWIDASGFHKILISKLDWPVKYYKQSPIDGAWVCQLDYQDVNQEMVNYTQSIAKNNGWMFKIGLYHRMGSGYCHSSSFISRDAARDEFLTMVDNRKRDPRLIKWEPQRLEYSAKGNTVAVGLSGGFIEPLEANALFMMINSITRLHDVLRSYFKHNETKFNFDKFNEIISYSVDDIADFILVHYTLSSRTDTEFWRAMQELGQKENHQDLLYEKYMNQKNSMQGALLGYTLFPDYMWAQLAYSWGLDLTKWTAKNIDPVSLEMARMHYDYSEKKNKFISKTRMPNQQWLKENIFDNMSSADWMKSKNIQ